MERSAFGRNVRAVRTAANLTQQQFADSIGVTVTTVSSWETRGGKPKQKEVVQAICDEFKVTERDLFGYDDGFYSRYHGLSEGPEPLGTGTMVPVLGRTHMGGPEDPDAADLNIEVPQNVVEAHPGCFLVHAEGGCMDNRYPADSYLLIDPHMEPRNGSAVLASTDDGRSVVRAYMRGSSTVMLCCDSHSETHPDIVAGPDDPPVILKGVVVWYQADRDVRHGS